MQSFLNTGGIIAVLLIYGYICGQLAQTIAESRRLPDAKAYIGRGVVLGVFAILWAAVAHAPPVPGENVRQGDIVRLAYPYNDGAGEMPAGWTARVNELNAFHGMAWVRVDGPDGGQHWVPKHIVLGV